VPNFILERRRRQILKTIKMNHDRTNYINQPVPIEKELKILFKQNEPLVIFEIGACEGEDSIKYSRLFINSKIYAFEPLPDNIKLIQNNLRQYGITNVSYYNKALSSSEGTAEFHVSEGKPETEIESDWDYGNKSSSLLPPARHLEIVNFIHFNRKIEVETITLKSFCKSNNIDIIDFIHMDVQGAELMVLEGASDFISSIKVVWLEVAKVEIYRNQPLEQDVKKFMTDNNFVLIKDSLEKLWGDQLYISKAFYPEYNSLFRPKSRLVSFTGRVLRRFRSS
jgi:FkbM family methyltransferase